MNFINTKIHNYTSVYTRREHLPYSICNLRRMRSIMQIKLIIIKLAVQPAHICNILLLHTKKILW